MNLSEDNILT